MTTVTSSWTSHKVQNAKITYGTWQYRMTPILYVLEFELYHFCYKISDFSVFPYAYNKGGDVTGLTLDDLYEKIHDIWNVSTQGLSTFWKLHFLQEDCLALVTLEMSHFWPCGGLLMTSSFSDLTRGQFHQQKNWRLQLFFGKVAANNFNNCSTTRRTTKNISSGGQYLPLIPKLPI